MLNSVSLLDLQSFSSVRRVAISYIYPLSLTRFAQSLNPTNQPVMSEAHERSRFANDSSQLGGQFGYNQSPLDPFS